MRADIGINPDLDYLYDPQQRDAADEYPKCSCCGRQAYPGEAFYELDIVCWRLRLCKSCKALLDINEIILVW